MVGSNEVEPGGTQYPNKDISPVALQEAVRVGREILVVLDVIAGEHINQFVDEKRAKWQVSPPLRLLRGATALIAGAGLLAANVHSEPETKVKPVPHVASCSPEDCVEQEITAGDRRTLIPRQKVAAPAIASPPTTPAEVIVTPPTTKPVVQIAPPSSLPPKATAQAQSTEARVELNVEVKRSFENIERMQLTREGLAQALTNINTSFYDYAQSKGKFNSGEMEKQGIPQGRTEFYTEHVTAGYYNSDGSVTLQPAGESNPQLFIDKITERDDARCCGVNQYIDRNAVVYWTAPRQAKLRHNSGYDGQTTGKEVEGYLFKDLTQKQLEASAYVDLGNLLKDELFDKDPTFIQTVRGHAKSRQQYNESHPNERKDIKIDWEEGETEAYRQKLRDFVAANPDWKQLIPQVFLDLP